MEDQKYLIGRQPILNRQEEIVAYELLFRGAGATIAIVGDASLATARVIVNALTAFGIEDILGNRKGFINLDHDLLMDDSLNILPKQHVVLELLETLKPTPELIERCRFLKESGFALALDDHVYSPAFHDLYEIVDIVKIDLLQTPAEELEETVGQFRKYRLQLLAEKVETQAELSRCLELGFELFQGYYFARPSILKKKQLDDSGSALIKVMRLLNEEAELIDIERVFRQHAGLVYRLLLLVNSVGLGSRNKIETLRHALSMLGRQQIKRWVQLSLFAGNDPRGMENPLVDMAAVRASFMENMARHYGGLKSIQDSGEKAFMTGILSILEKAYEIPMDEVVRTLNLSDDVQQALTSRSGGFGRLLHVTELLERLEFDHVGSHLSEMGVSVAALLESQKLSYAWRNRML